MSFRDRMRVDPSNAEIQVSAELQRQKMYGLERDWVLVLEDDQVTPKRKEQVLIKDLEGHMFTLPDWFSKDMKAIYLDGPVHLKPRREAHDAFINMWLTERGCDVLRIPYNGRRLSYEGLRSVVGLIREFMQK